MFTRKQKKIFQHYGGRIAETNTNKIMSSLHSRPAFYSKIQFYVKSVQR